MILAPACDLPGLLVLLPYHVGFHLDGSLVVVALCGSRMDLVERVDLPAAGSLDSLTTARLVSALRRRRPTSILVVAYADTTDPGDALDAVVAEAGMIAPVGRAVVVRHGRWGDRGHAPHVEGEWRDLPDPSEVPLVAELVGRGVAPFASRDALVLALAPVGDDDLGARIAARGRPDLATGLQAWDRLLAGEDREEDTVTALALLRRVPDRDALLTRLVPVAGERRSAPAPVPWAVDARDPAAHRARVRSILIGLARLAPPALRAAALSTLAVWAWDVGDGATASIAAELALRHEPEYSLAVLVAQLVYHDIRPPVA